MNDVHDCIRRQITVDGENVYVLVGLTFAAVTGRFENRHDLKPMSREGSEKVNETITELLELLENE